MVMNWRELGENLGDGMSSIGISVPSLTKCDATDGCEAESRVWLWEVPRLTNLEATTATQMRPTR